MTRGTPRSTTLSAFLARLIWACVSPLVLLAGYLAFDNVRTVRSNEQAEATNLARNVATTLDKGLAARIGGLQILAASPLADTPSRWKEFHAEALGFRESLGTHVILADLDMRMQVNTRLPFGTPLPPLPRPEGRAAAPTAVRTGRPAIGDVFASPITKEPLVALAAPGLRDGKVAFVLLTILDTRQLQANLDEVALPPGWIVSLRDGTGVQIARRGPSGDGAPATVQRFSATSALSPWSVELEIPRDANDAPFSSAAIALAIALFGATAAGVLGGVQAGRRLAASVTWLGEAPAGKAPDLDIDEIAAVRRALDESSRRRDAAEAARHEVEERFRVIFEQAAVGMALVAPDGHWLLANAQFCEIVGYSSDQLLGMGLQDITHVDDLGTDLVRVRRLLAGEIDTSCAEKRYVRADGRDIWVKVTTALVRHLDGTPHYFVSVIEDIQRRKEAEEALRALNAHLENRVAERTSELEAANRELQAFDYSVSHDLRAPLNRIRGFGEALAERYATVLPSEGMDLLRRIESASATMDRMVTDLLALSVMAQGDVHRSEVDLGAITRNVLDSFRRTEPGRAVEVAIEAEVHAAADPGLMRIALENLLANAWRFTSRKEGARIEFGCEHEGGETRYFVRDNGAGFDPALAAKLFRPFRRLHSQGDFPGSGIGLATVHRIVRRHGGRVWAQGAMGEGATFWFTLTPTVPA